LGESLKAIDKFEPLFTTRTGLTLLLKKHPIFEGKPKEGFFFTKDAQDPSVVWVISDTEKVLLTGLKKEHLESSIAKGFIMFYETDKKDEVVRNTLCRYKA